MDKQMIMEYLWMLFVLCVGIQEVYTIDIIGPVDYCNRDRLNITCGTHEVILINNARYGRMQKGDCISVTLGFIGCAADVRNHLDSLCSGRQTCSMKVPDDTLYNQNPCPKDTVSYLEVSWSCVKVHVDEARDCTSSGFLPIQEPHGYLSTTMSEQYGYGSNTCPWVIQAEPGQRINITMYSFLNTNKGTDSEMPGQTYPRSDACYEVATVQEPNLPETSMLACIPVNRFKQEYVTEGNTLHVTIPRRNMLNNYGAFIIQYQVFGCARPKAPPNTWLQVTGDRAVVKCNKTGATWYMTCKHTQWIGTPGNCTTDDRDPNWPPLKIFTPEQFPYGILLAVSIGVALGVFIGGVLLSIIVINSKRKRRRRSAKMDAQCPPLAHTRYSTPMEWHTDTELCEAHDIKDIDPDTKIPQHIPCDIVHGTINKKHYYESPRFV